MKKTIKGICYDSDIDVPKCAYRHGRPIGSIIETAYLTSAGQYYLLQAIGNENPKIILMSNEDMARWTAPGNGETAFSKP